MNNFNEIFIASQTEQFLLSPSLRITKLPTRSSCTFLPLPFFFDSSLFFFSLCIGTLCTLAVRQKFITLVKSKESKEIEIEIEIELEGHKTKPRRREKFCAKSFASPVLNCRASYHKSSLDYAAFFTLAFVPQTHTHTETHRNVWKIERKAMARGQSPAVGKQSNYMRDHCS